MFAVIETGGKQYKVAEGDVITIEKIDEEVGKPISFEKILLIDDGKETKLGDPYLKGAKVSGKIESEIRGKKVSVIKFKRKINYFRNYGHRQPYTKVKITEVKNA
ncbi:MAG: 50S ribosomal protein L21 [Candidatus Campbellbacteria bacterium]|nr:50S ribosomal protein L21 [Candidatus Campbellbacteria bacterium]